MDHLFCSVFYSQIRVNYNFEKKKKYESQEIPLKQFCRLGFYTKKHVIISLVCNRVSLITPECKHLTYSFENSAYKTNKNEMKPNETAPRFPMMIVVMTWIPNELSK